MPIDFRINLQLFADGKTEPATPRRREEARKKGQVAKSQELNTALLLLGMALLLGVSGEWAIARLALFVRQVLGDGVGRVEFSLAGIQGLHSHAVLCIVVVAGPVMGTALALGLVSQFLQVGFNFTTEPLAPQLNRLNPVEGAKRIFSKRAFVELLKSCLKIAIVAYVAYSAIGKDLNRLQALLWVEPIQAAAFTMEGVRRIGLWTGACLLALAGIDYLYQRWEYEESLKMSVQDVKDELKETEGDPQIRSAIRARQRQLANSRMMQAVPTADVVITNPTHFAVALKYDARSMAAPMVVAKGADYLAARIRQIAVDNDVPIVENPPLARALYDSVPVGREIPADLYQAVAEVLAYVYRL
ncbi:MAG: flagellar biosynthesis protein FlhB [Firmicutes bacterium]|nr:flagellar biosynthesis protein FlhB [Bacillota bacterium]